MEWCGSVQIISKELIKPSSSTPHHLRNLKLSLLDQLSPPVYVPVIFFYEADELRGLSSSIDPAQVCRNLKQSLSNTLTLFYPLAGKIDPENVTVCCDDTGVEFIEAHANARLRDVIQEPELDQFQKYLPVELLEGIYIGEGTLLMVQINFFECGGVAIGVCMSHLVADASSLVEFMNAWAATCRGENPKSAPEFGVMARYFPAQDLSDSNVSPALLMGNDKLVMKRFVFDKEKLAALKQAAATGDGSDVKDPTRVEAVSAFILKYFIENNLLDAKKSLVAAHMVNIRSRAIPSLENAFGNGCFLCAAELGHDQGSWPLPELVSKLRRAMRTIDDEYIRETEREDRYLSDLGKLCNMVSEGDADGFVFSSWCRFPTYEVDLGWGKPVWVCTTALQVNHLVILTSTRDGDGIEAWINLLPDQFQSLENQFKLIGSTRDILPRN
ncbi:UNVERIFIED_CONTAM: Stemmadenine O-acetyltransferase [Sesamum latifolium]|uniref:Stemmadenine O-acetyltransferase n=1 Tax=Sesamum latifolium TaxID=2727402 RepID=A0AAW2YEY0_9LAMI